MHTTAVIAAANEKDKKNFKIVWTNNLYTIDSWVIMKGSPNKADAEKFLVFVNDPQNQKNLPPKIPYGVTTKAATALIDKNVLPNLATAPREHQDGALYQRQVLAREPRQAQPTVQCLGRQVDPAERRRGPRLRRGAEEERDAARTEGGSPRAAASVFPRRCAFIAPIGAMLARGVTDTDIARILPRVTAELGQWNGRDLPPESAYARPRRRHSCGARSRHAGERRNTPQLRRGGLPHADVRYRPCAAGGARRLRARSAACHRPEDGVSAKRGPRCGERPVPSPISTCSQRSTFGATRTTPSSARRPSRRYSATCSAARCGSPAW